MLGHKVSFNKFEKIEIISCIFSDHSGMKQETNNKDKKKKHKHLEDKHAAKQPVGL